ncbi:MAG: DNA mismatch repair protein MutS [Gemmobacter sp.]
MMAQYLAIKAEVPDAILFYRMGDFYEMFFDDAVAAAAALDIALTKRGLHLGQDIPMCGVPVVSAEGYLMALIGKGFRVAIAEQVEDPAAARKRGAKAVVRREIVRIMTPGTLTEDTLLEARRANWLCAWAEVRDEGALAWVDISTGDMRVAPMGRARLPAMLARLAPRELLVSEAGDRGVEALADELGVTTTPLGRSAFDSVSAERRICAAYGVSGLEGFGAFGRAEVAALGALVQYLELTQRGRMPLLAPPVREAPGAAMQIDPATRRSLEITAAMAGGREGSLIAAVDRTVTAGGGRLLERRLAAPSTDLAEIRARVGAVGRLVEAAVLRRALRDALAGVPDMDRALSRLALDRGGPRDLAALRDGLRGASAVAALLAGAEGLLEAPERLGGAAALAAELERVLVAAPPPQLRDGGFVAPGVEPELDETRALRDESRGVIAAMQGEYAAETGIASLKIRHNNVLGYFVEVTAVHGARMLGPPLSGRFVHRQTTAQALRFTTLELAALETRIVNAAAHALDLERAVFERLRGMALAAAGAVAEAARALAEIDVTAGWAEIAAEEGWCAPVVDDSRAFAVEAGRHPVVERALRRAGQPFVANDCALSEGGTPAIWLITGPNMAGKSTFLRQNALIAVIAQAGGWVPAAAARIGLVSAVFSRVGAADDLARGRSTFMVEMVETAGILNQADDRALVILDEIGRGTATWDGLSIAWAVLEHLQAVNRCRALFATHYHEMTALAGRLEGVENATVAVKEWDGDVIFLHEVRQGAADRSYGVQVARLAGLPRAVVDRARVVLEQLEKSSREGRADRAALVDDLPLFAPRAATPAAPVIPAGAAAALVRLGSVDPDALSPRDALALVYELRGMLGDG